MNSLQARLLGAGLLVLVLFVILTGVALERAVVRHAEQAERDRMRGLVYGLLGAAEPASGGGVQLDLRQLPEVQLARPGSGLAAALLGSRGEVIWRSPSALAPLQVPAPLPGVGEWQFARRAGAAGTSHFVLAFGLSWWLEDAAEPIRYTVLVQQDTADFERQRARFRQVLWLWLAAAATVLLAVQWSVLRWGIRPLRDLGAELHQLQAGQREGIAGRYPAELRPLARGLNTLLGHERAQQRRYRDAVADLAHSMKTPLAVLRGLAAEGPSATSGRQLEEQVRRLDEIIARQLRRAAAAGSRTWHGRAPLGPALERLSAALTKVYGDKRLAIDLAVEAVPEVPMEEGDLMELLGNLMDNACKHARRRVAVSAGAEAGRVWIQIDDDGPGFPPGAEQRLLERGVRLDSRHEGQGLGLALAREVVLACAGSLSLGAAPGGGGRVRIELPS